MHVSRLIQLKPDEEVLMTVRGSLIPLWSKLTLAFVWLVLPFFLLFPLFHMHLIGVVLFFVLLFSGIVYAFRLYVMWQETVFVLTDQRLIDIDRTGLFGREVSEARYAQVRDVSFAIRGVWPTLFRYGTLTLRIIGSPVDLVVYHVRRPQKPHDLINDLRHVEVS